MRYPLFLLTLLVILALWAGSAAAALIINELQSDNEQTVADDHGEFDDWLEILNTGPASVDLTGYRISDDADLGTYHVLDGPLTVAAGARLILWADGQADQGPAHLPFRLSSGGETVTLISPDGLSVVDQVEYPRQFSDHVYQRYPDAGGAWTWGRDPSPLGANLAPHHDGFLVLNELMPANESVITDDHGQFDPWLEIHNPLLDPVSVVGMTLSAVGGGDLVLPPQVLPPLSYTLVWVDGEPEQGVWHGPALLSDAGGGLVLHCSDGVVASEVIYPALAPDVALARMPDGGPWQSTVLVTPGQTNPATASPVLVINEFLASNQDGIVDELGDAEDWVEIYNPGATPVSLAGFTLTDDLAAPDQWQLPAVTLAGGDYLLIWCDNDPEEGIYHASFKLSAGGEELGLFQGDDLVDSIVFGAQTTDVSYGRRVDAGLPWITFAAPTPLAPNHPVVAAPMPAAGLQFLPPSPNPFNPRVMLAWQQEVPGRVNLQIHDVQGRRLVTLSDRWYQAGRHLERWDGRDGCGRDLPSGVYTVRISLGTASETRSITLVR